MSEKHQLRQSLFAADRAWNANMCAVQSKKICTTAVEKLALNGNVLCFMPLEDEVDITPLFEVIRSRGGCVILPYCVDASHMILKHYEPDAALVQDAMHVWAPESGQIINANMIDEAIIPAVALTMSGKRLGRGGGFYDRLITQFRHDTVKVGVCYQHRVLSDLPMDQYDVLVDFVISAYDML